MVPNAANYNALPSFSQLCIYIDTPGTPPYNKLAACCMDNDPRKPCPPAGKTCVSIVQ